MAPKKKAKKQKTPLLRKPEPKPRAKKKAAKEPPAPPKVMGRPRKEVDWVIVNALCKIQCTAEEISAVIDVSTDTITARCIDEHGVTFAEYFNRNKLGGKASLRRAQWVSANKDRNPSMLKHLGEHYLDQISRREISGIEGNPIEFKEVEPPQSQDALNARIDELLGKMDA